MPPSDMRTNSRPSARAMDCPSEVFPTLGGPTIQRIGSRFSAALVGVGRAPSLSALVVADSTLLWRSSLSLRTQVFKDAIFDLFQVIVVFVEHLARVGDINLLAG